jgi:diguanylate cyclase (GGDEF)-like protein/PAS domain S-box-containing protein
MHNTDVGTEVNSNFNFYHEIRIAILLSIVTLLVGLYLTHNKWVSTKEIIYQSAEIAFIKKFDELSDGISSKLAAYQQVLRATQGLFYASETVSRDEFKVFNQQLKLAEHYPGIQGIGHVILIPSTAKAAHISAVRAEGFPEYKIMPDSERDTYSSILYIEPFDMQNRRAFGFDMYSEPVRRKAMSLARETGRAVLTEKVVLVQDLPESSAAGLLMYKPLFHEHLNMTSENRVHRLYGWVYAVFRIDDFLRDLLVPVQHMMDIRLVDIAAAAPNQNLYGQLPNTGFEFFQTKEIIVGSRVWAIQATSTPEFEAGVNVNQAYLIGLMGIFVSILFAALVGFLASGRANALRVAQKITHSLRLNEARLTAAKNAAGIGIWDWDIQQDTINWDNNMFRLYGLKDDQAKITYADWSNQVHRDDLPTVEDAVQKALKDRSPYDAEFRIYLPDNKVRMIKAAGNVTYDGGGKPIRMIGTNIDVTDEWMNERDLKDSETRLRAAVEGAGDGVWDWSIQDGKVIFSTPLITMLGYDPHEFSPNVVEWSSRIHPDDMSSVTHDIQLLINEPGYKYRNEHRLQCKDGSWKWVLDRGMVITRDAAGEPIRAIGTHTDISKQKSIEAALRESEERFRNSFETAAIGMALISVDGRWLKVNHSLCKMLGYTEAELLEKTFQDITYKHDLETDLTYLQQLVSGEINNFKLEKRYVSKSEDLISVMLSVSAVRDEKGQVIHFVSQIEDITSRKHEDESIRAIAFIDPLTGLPNRRLFMERLSQTLARAKRYMTQFAVMFIDVDHFKHINDTHGHEVGDSTLKIVAERVQSCLRDTDTVSRFGGDEFVVLLDSVNTTQNVLNIAESIRLRVAETTNIEALGLQVRLSMGISIYDVSHGDDATSLLNKADKALYNAKAAGRNNVKLFE